MKDQSQKSQIGLGQFAMNAKQAIIVTCNPPDDIPDKEREDFEEQLNKLKAAGASRPAGC